MSDIQHLPKPNGLSRQTDLQPCSREKAAEYAAILVGCYRRDDVASPEIFLRSVILVLSEFPEWIIRKVCDPARGLPSKQAFLPTIFEIREACEFWMKPTRESERRRKMAEEQPYQITDPATRARNIERIKGLLIALQNTNVPDLKGSPCHEPQEKSSARLMHDRLVANRKAQLAKRKEEPLKLSPSLVPVPFDHEPLEEPF